MAVADRVHAGREDLGRDIQQVRGGPQLTIVGRVGASAFGFALFDVPSASLNGRSSGTWQPLLSRAGQTW